MNPHLGNFLHAQVVGPCCCCASICGWGSSTVRSGSGAIRSVDIEIVHHLCVKLICGLAFGTTRITATLDPAATTSCTSSTGFTVGYSLLGRWLGLRSTLRLADALAQRFDRSGLVGIENDLDLAGY